MVEFVFFYYVSRNYLPYHQLGGKHKPLENWIIVQRVSCKVKLAARSN